MIWMLIALLTATADAKPCWVPDKMPRAGRSVLDIRTAEDLQAREAEAAAAEMREVQPVEVGGAVVLRVERSTIEGATERHHTIILASEGQEVARTTGAEGVRGVPQTPSGPYRYWRSIIVAPIPAGVAWPITVYAVDGLHAHRCAWEVDERGKIKRLKRGGPPLR